MECRGDIAGYYSWSMYFRCCEAQPEHEMTKMKLLTSWIRNVCLDLKSRETSAARLAPYLRSAALLTLNCGLRQILLTKHSTALFFFLSRIECTLVLLRILLIFGWLFKMLCVAIEIAKRWSNLVGTITNFDTRLRFEGIDLLVHLLFNWFSLCFFGLCSCTRSANLSNTRSRGGRLAILTQWVFLVAVAN